MNKQLLWALLPLTLAACGGGGDSAPAENNAEKPTQFTLSVSAASGTISSSPAGINCGNDCSENYDQATSVTLTATPDSGYDFTGWGGACSGITTCTISLTENTSVSAIFTEQVVVVPKFALSVASENGVVSSTPSGINCGSDCSEDFDENASISLTAIANEGFQFSAWSGACTGTESCSVSMSEAKQVTATFTAIPVEEPVILIQNYTKVLKTPAMLDEINGNASGVTWHPIHNQYLVVKNGAGRLYRYDEQFNHIEKDYLKITKESDVDLDTEGVAYLGGNAVIVVTELNYAHKFTIGTDNLDLPASFSTVPSFQLLAEPATSNKGLEGVAVRPASEGVLAKVYACQEGTGAVDEPNNNDVAMKIVSFELPTEDPTTLLSYNSNLTVDTTTLDAETLYSGEILDCAGLTYDERTGHLLILSEQSSKILQVDPADGKIISTLTLAAAIIPNDEQQFEGITIGPNGELVLVSEKNWVYVLGQAE